MPNKLLHVTHCVGKKRGLNLRLQRSQARFERFAVALGSVSPRLLILGFASHAIQDACSTNC